MADQEIPGSVVVQVVDVSEGREISWNSSLVERLKDRAADVRSAIIAGAQAINADVNDLPTAEGWQIKELSATFGITLSAEAGVVLSRASAESTFEVTVTIERA
ncbi:CU044_2847 family protein [Actinoplanes sp. NPDC023801]|uniref:CU044_2847 family protein n=1 Tax=Actinoplanes sp. NPDC023801 TaxID=3154595 RepID=UPI0033F62F7D